MPSRIQLLLLFTVISAVVIGTADSASFEPPQWAYGAGEKGKPYPDDGQPKRLAGSTRANSYPSWPLAPVTRIIGYPVFH